MNHHAKLHAKNTRRDCHSPSCSCVLVCMQALLCLNDISHTCLSLIAQRVFGSVAQIYLSLGASFTFKAFPMFYCLQPPVLSVLYDSTNNNGTGPVPVLLESKTLNVLNQKPPNEFITDSSSSFTHTHTHTLNCMYDPPQRCLSCLKWRTKPRTKRDRIPGQYFAL